MNKPMVLTEANFSNDVEQATGLMLVDFWAAWCGPCRAIAPVIEQIADENEGKLKVGKLDVDNNSDLAMRYGVMSIPTLILFKDGKPVKRMVGAMPKPQLMAQIKPFMN
jgi:thioredoxin 1